MDSENSFWTHDATVCVRCPNAKDVFAGLMKVLDFRGYAVGPDPRIEKDYPILGVYHRKVTRQTPAGLLEVDAEYHRAGLKLEAYQNVVFENPSGGKYDFDKLRKMPHLARLRWLLLRDLAFDYLRTAGLTHRPDLPADASPLDRFNHGTSGWGPGRFRRGPDGWPDDTELRSWSRKTADGGTMTQGAVAWCACRATGRWVRGRAYGGINGMWKLYQGHRFLDNRPVGNFRLSPPERVRGRQFTPYQRRRKLAAAFQAAVAAKQYRRVAAIALAADRLGFDLGD